MTNDPDERWADFNAKEAIQTLSCQIPRIAGKFPGAPDRRHARELL